MEDIKVIDLELNSIHEEDIKKIKVTQQNYNEILKTKEEELFKSKLDEQIEAEEAKLAQLKEEAIEKEEAVNMFEDAAEEKPVEIEEKPVEIEEKEVVESEIENDLEKEVMPFAYHYEEPEKEEEVAPETIEKIKELGEAYKGQPKTDFSKVMDTVPKKEEHKVTPEEFEEELNKSSYSPKINKYKENMKAEYEALKAEIEANKEQLNSLKHAIKDAEDVSESLKQQLTEPLSIVDKINGLDLSFLSDESDENEEAKVALQSMGVLYNSTRDIATNLQNQLKENIAKTKELKEEEEKTIEKGTDLKNKKETFETEKYNELVKVNAKDEELKANDMEISEITGITEVEKEAPVVDATPLNETSSEENVFEDSITKEEEPKFVIDVQSYGDVMGEVNSSRIA